MSSTRELRTHIRSIRATRQITKAMEMVAAAKLRRASDATVASRPYSLRIAEALRDALIVSDNHEPHPLSIARPATKTLLIVISSDRGLAGSYNTAVIREVLRFVEEEKKLGHTVQCISFGKKAERMLLHSGIEILQSYPHATTHPVAGDVLPLARTCINDVLNGTFDRVSVISTHFVNSFRQEVRIQPILPLMREDIVVESTANEKFNRREARAEKGGEHLFLTEPSPEALLDLLIPRYVETILYQLLQDSLASEHAARRMAMHSATENASGIIDKLQLTYNTVRQGTITRELAEITSGTIALES